MQAKKIGLGVVLVATLGIAACADTRPDMDEVRRSGDYWGRNDDVSSLYLRGPKAQHTLQTDMSMCVAQVKELVKLGAIRRAEPPQDLALESGLARGWDAPNKNGPLYSEYQDFTDFESCMASKGWQRRENVTPVEAEQATATYGEVVYGLMPTIGKTDAATTHTTRQAKPASYNYNTK